MTEVIYAKANPRLLTKADRLFTGTVDGRIIEILQNARRAGATEVRITNQKGFVTVADNGCGIEDFQKLLDLGGSGWEERIEAGEDPSRCGPMANWRSSSRTAGGKPLSRRLSESKRKPNYGCVSTSFQSGEMCFFMNHILLTKGKV